MCTAMAHAAMGWAEAATATTVTISAVCDVASDTAVPLRMPYYSVVMPR